MGKYFVVNQISKLIHVNSWSHNAKDIKDMIL